MLQLFMQAVVSRAATGGSSAKVGTALELILQGGAVLLSIQWRSQPRARVEVSPGPDTLLL